MIRERFYRRAPSNYQLNKKIKKLEDEQEIKYKDIWHTITATRTPDVQGQVFLLNGTQVGPYATGERIGSQIRATSLQLRGYFYIPLLGTLDTPITDTLRAPMIRLIVFWVTNPVGTPVIVGNSDTALDGVLDNIIGSTADNIFAPYQFQSYPAIKVLYDKTYRFPQPTIVISGGYAKTCSCRSTIRTKYRISTISIINKQSSSFIRVLPIISGI